MKFGPANGISDAPGNDTVSEPVQDAGPPLRGRRKVAAPEKGGGGITLAAVSGRLDLKSDRDATTETQRTIETAPSFSVELATKLARCRWRPTTAAAKANALCAVVASKNGGGGT